MKRCSILGFFLLICAQLGALEVQPWFGDVYEFHLLSGYSYSRFRTVQGAITQPRSPSNDNLFFMDLEFSFSPQWSIDADLEFAATPRQSFGFRSTAFQMRYLWLDDIIGDSVSLATGANFRYVSTKSLHDISCPYAATGNVELNLSIGKEFDTQKYWRFRFWGFGAVGLANRGSPWVHGIISGEGNFREVHKGAIFVEGFHGYGKDTLVDIQSFDGYGRVRQKWVDIGARYGQRLGVWGTLRFEYKRRVLAKSCPEHVDTFCVSYLLPFSF